MGNEAENLELQETREAIIVSERRYRRLFESAKDGILILDVDTGKIIDVNPYLVDLLGYDRDQFVGKALWEIGLFKDIAANRENFKILQDNKYIRFEDLPLQTANGGKIDVEFVSNVYKENHTNVIQCNIRDITERKRTTDLIAAGKERLSVTLSSIGDGVIATDAKGKIDILNLEAEKMCGWSQKEARGKPLATVFNIINETTRKPHPNPVDKVLETGEIIELENHTVIISKTGTERIIADSAAPIKNSQGTIIGVVLVFRDITEKQRLLEASQKNQKLESLGLLAAGIAHDFNNLMGGIFGYIDLALALSSEDTVKNRLTKALVAIDRARALTRQLLTFATGGSPVKEIIELSEFIEPTARFALAGSQILLKSEIPINLWMCDADRNQFAQVIENIVINARQAMPSGGVMTISAENVTLQPHQHPLLPEGQYIKISLKDTGIGMSNATLSSIFDPFFTTKIEGHGLGLATCHSIIKRHNGAIDVSSAIDEGTTFDILLPASDKQTPDAPHLHSEHRGTGRVLVMDDEEIMRDTIGEMLESFGYNVVSKNEGEQALEFVADESKNHRSMSALILDLTVPGGMAGGEIIGHIRKINPDIPVFVASGYAEHPIVQNPADFGFTASISKPFLKNEPAHLLEQFLQGANKHSPRD